MSNQTDNAKFTFSPTQVTDGSAQDKLADRRKHHRSLQGNYPGQPGGGHLHAHPLRAGRPDAASHDTGGRHDPPPRPLRQPPQPRRPPRLHTPHSTTSTSTSTTSTTPHDHNLDYDNLHDFTQPAPPQRAPQLRPPPPRQPPHTTPHGRITFTSPSPGKSLLQGVQSVHHLRDDLVRLQLSQTASTSTVQLLQGSSAVMDSSVQRPSRLRAPSPYTTHVGEPYSWTSGPYLVNCHRLLRLERRR
jgi:hypothetical protein